MKLFEKNEGPTDRAIRAILGIAALAGFFTGILSPPLSYLLALAGVLLLFTAIIGSCTLYTLLGIKTNK